MESSLCAILGAVCSGRAKFQVLYHLVQFLFLPFPIARSVPVQTLELKKISTPAFWNDVQKPRGPACGRLTCSHGFLFSSDRAKRYDHFGRTEQNCNSLLLASSKTVRPLPLQIFYKCVGHVLHLSLYEQKPVRPNYRMQLLLVPSKNFGNSTTQLSSIRASDIFVPTRSTATMKFTQSRTSDRKPLRSGRVP